MEKEHHKHDKGRERQTADCARYPTRLASHSVKVSEPIDRRIRDIIRISTKKSRFVANCGTMDAIHGAHLLIEKHCKKQKPLHVPFHFFEKAFDSFAHEVTWYPLRLHVVAEEFIEWVRIPKQTRRFVYKASLIPLNFPSFWACIKGQLLTDALDAAALQTTLCSR